MFDRITRTKCILEGADTKCEPSERNSGFVGLPPGKIFMTTPFKLLENGSFFWRICNLKKNSIMSDGGPPKKFKKIASISPVDT